LSEIWLILNNFSKMGDKVEILWKTLVVVGVFNDRLSWYNGLDQTSTTKTQLIHNQYIFFNTPTPNNPPIHSPYNYY